MKFNVYLTAFMNGEIREVEVPLNECHADPQSVLDRIFYWGQNDFQPVPCKCSVSAGDVIDFYGKLYMVLMCGFQEISQKQLNEFKSLSQIGKNHWMMENLYGN